ncbi:hypothetical protein GCM10011507_26790 [Edaphobacter acidisoli]|uniref:VTT domain-containing protein n=1 Tax=Edaphobacter acidisoli TaxID=2040573 RepID=A0A916RWQ6_9BACT|nr:VTT domain-containing protein [Edaphobacter acidisoli]GGA74079.1 hypothetical protein GCM10011507_26790 [Edaphobacter acidisoli]
MKIPASIWIHKANVALQALGVWGLGAMALVDSSSVPMPLDALLIKDVAENHSRFVIYCLIAALGSAIGSLVPYYLGRAGGELILLKRINRQRYEQLRDRFEKQEFLAIMVPAMLPPPMPIKLFELAAGVFEMKPAWFFSAMLTGKFLRFMLWAVITILYGPKIISTMTKAVHDHLGYVLGAGGIVVVLIVVYVVRKLFDRRRGTQFPVED